MRKEYPGIRARLVGGLLYTLIVAAFVVSGFFHVAIALTFFLLLATLMCGEALQALSKKITGISLFPAIAGVVFTFIWPLIQQGSVGSWLMKSSISVTLSLLTLGFFSLLLVLLPLMKQGGDAIPSAVAEAATTIYVFASFSVLAPLLLFVPRGLIWFVLALLAPAASDVFAYFGGVRFGKKKIVPKLSPAKTWGGTLFGLLGSVLLCLLFFLIWLKPPALSFFSILLLALISGVLLSIFAQAGDWFASAIKRYVGIKDFSTLIPGHGGLFDRLDSLLPVLPLVFLLSLYVEAVLR